MTKLNVGCGQQIEIGHEWINIDVYPQHPLVKLIDVDDGLPYDDDSFDELRVWGNLSEFKRDVMFHMNNFWRVLQNGGILDVKIAVVDNGTGAFRDPIARRYLNSQWVEYFFIGGKWENSGYGLGFKGKFEMVSNEVAGEVHRVILKAVK